MLDNLNTKGNQTLLEDQKIAILASRTLLPHLTERVISVCRQLAVENNILISGWHSPMEVEIHRLLIKDRKPHIHIGAKAIDELFCILDHDKVFFVTHCLSTIKRVTRENSLKRNQVICELSDMILIPWLDPNGKTHSIVNEFCKKKPVYIFDSQYNRVLLKNGAELVGNLTI